MSTDTLPVSEVFGPTIQGEGMLVGMPSVFIRLGGCDFRCSWCDTPYAVLPEHAREWEHMSPQDIAGRVRSLVSSPTLITLTGGNPALYDCQSLIDELRADSHQVACETQGTTAAPWFERLDYLVLSPKPPSSGMPFDEAKLNECVDSTPSYVSVALKVVVFDRADYDFARYLDSLYRDMPFYITPGTPPMPRADRAAGDQAGQIAATVDQLLSWCVQDSWTTGLRIIPQVHALLWPEVSRGK